MPKRHSNSRALRELAEALLRDIAAGEKIPERELTDLATSLVRQWITYDGHATLFFGDEQVYFRLDRTPLGRPRLVPTPGRPGWLNCLIRDWKVDPDQWPEIVDQLNRGQSAEVTNGDGLPLRLWVNPREGGRGVEALAEEKKAPLDKKLLYHKIAASEIESALGPELEPDELEALACSVARQWQTYEGHACLFVTGAQLIFTLRESANGKCVVDAGRVNASIEPSLAALGVPVDFFPDVVARLNLGQEVELTAPDGARSLLSYDPKARKLRVRPLAAMPQQDAQAATPILCPRCGAVLRPWWEGQGERTCPQCHNTVR